MAYRLGIDLGTSTLMAAALRPGAAAALVVLGDGRPEASVVDVRDPGLGDEQATAALLRLARDRAAEQLGEPPDEVVLAVPGWWGDVQRAAFDAAVEAAELGPVRRIDQAEAAALGYAAQVLVPLGARIAVFDLGAASCAAAVLERVPAGFTVLASAGAEQPCGNDFDEAVSRLVAGGLGGDRDAGDPARAAAIRRACTTAREALSTQSRVEVSVPGASGSVPLSRTEVEGLIRGPIRTGLELIDQVLRDAGVAPADLTALVGVGGCCRTPIVRTLLGKEFAAPVAVSDRPEFAVAIGSVGDADTCLTATPKPPVEVPPAAAAGAAPAPVEPAATASMPVTPHSAP
ncbi:MAG: Hsp70 family protein, partial [Propionibacterium sp.]|nr:Hsp70 family protein [Propionibacterium sp.]